MLPEHELKNALATHGLSRLQSLMLCMSVCPEKSLTTSELKKIAVANGLRAAKDWNIASIFARARELVVNTNQGWRLTRKGQESIILIENVEFAPPEKISRSLRTHLAKLNPGAEKDFIEEAVKCFEHRLFRAAVVLSWVGAVSVLYDFVIAKKLSEYNAEALKRNQKHKQIVTKDDLAKTKESDFLDILEAISVLGKSVKTELKGCLDLRNGCGHPNSLKVSENRVAAHIEVLVDHVFSVFLMNP